jgi:hypothetical protein
MSTETTTRPAQAGPDITGVADQMIQAATTATGAYLDGIDRAVELQRQLTAGTPFQAWTELFAAQAGATRRVVEGYAEVAERVPATAAQVRATTQDAATSVTRETTEAATRVTRRTGRATTKAAKRTRGTVAKAAAPAAKPAKPAPPIEGYDGFTAEQLIAKLPELSQTVLTEVRRHERANAKRATVLERVEALQGPEPAPGYDELTVEDITKLLAGATPELTASVREYERRHKGRAGVLQATEPKTAS